MKNETYNGWPNRATWAVNNWLNNDEHTQGLWSRKAGAFLAKSLRDGEELDRAITYSANALADHMRCSIEEDNPLTDDGGTLYSDLLNIAIANVDWKHLARSWVEGEKDKVIAVVAAERAADEED